MHNTKKTPLEFIVMMASLMSITSLSIDALLPGLPEISETIGITDSKNNQLLITMIFLGLGFGQLISGPLSDSLGRKPVLYLGISVFTIASLLCIFSTNMEMMIIGRILQGIGLSAPRTVSMAMVRDRFSGDLMARIMSFVTVIFILMPVVAPSFGQLMLISFGWKSIFYSQLILGFIVTFWIWKRQPETLKEEHRKKVEFSLFTDGVKEFVKYKQAVVFTLVIGLVLGGFMTYLSSSQQIFQEQYGLIEEFPLIFAGIAIGIGLATFLNGTFVLRFGMLKLASIFIFLFTLLSLVYVVVFYGSPNPSSLITILFFGIILFCIGFIFGNINALAMQPIGHIAGIGAAIIGFTSTIMAVPIAAIIGSFIELTVLPLFIGFSICGFLSLLLIQYIKFSGKRKQSLKVNSILITDSKIINSVKTKELKN